MNAAPQESNGPNPPPERGSRVARMLRSGRLTMAIMVVLIAGAHLSGGLNGLDRALTDFRFKLLSRDASGDTVLVTIDPRSLSELGAWPWSRSLHADVIAKLTEAGAFRIGIDIDFSSPSSKVGDAALVDALSRSDGKVILPVFKQWAERRGAEVVHTAPPVSLSQHTRLGTVNVRPAADGLVRIYDRLQVWRDAMMPSFASAVSGTTTTGTRPFIIDFGIRAETIPRVSFVDVINGNYNPGTFAGKAVMIGATALELGDEIAVPVYGSLSGVEVQALAAESLLQNRALTEPPTAVGLLVALAIALALARWFASAPRLWSVAALVIGSVVLIVAPMVIQAYSPINAPTGTCLVALGLCFVQGLTRQIDVQAADLFKRATEARERRALFESIVETNFDGIIVIDDDNTVRHINPTACRILKWQPEAAIGRELDLILPSIADIALAPKPESKNLQAFETTIRRADDVELPVEIVCSELVFQPSSGPFERRTQERRFNIVTFRDIAERKRAERVMTTAAKRAVEADRMKNEFIANMSHEVRTPLNAIIGFAEVIHREMFGPLGNENYRSYARDIYSSGTHLLSIINDLLEVSKIAAGKVELEKKAIDLDTMISGTLRIVRGYPGASKLLLSSNIEPGCPRLSADERATRQILLNLLSNAIKFTSPGGNIRVIAGPTPLGGVVITVADEGIGIPADEIPNITKPFHQVEGSAHRHHSGTGLGLHIVQSLVEMHGASMSVSSTVGHGTNVTLEFPPETAVEYGNVIPLDNRKKPT